MLTTPDSRRYSMSGGPTCGVSSAKSGRRKTVSCCGQDESYAAGVATDASVSPDWLSRQHHAALFSNRQFYGMKGCTGTTTQGITLPISRLARLAATGRLDWLVMPAERKYFDFGLDYILITG